MPGPAVVERPPAGRLTSGPRRLLPWQDVCLESHSSGLSLLPLTHPDPTEIHSPRWWVTYPPDRQEIIAAIDSLAEVTEGADQIPAEMAKDPTFTDAIESLINLIWRTRDVPVDWQRTIMLGLRKDNRKPLDAENCRGISLTSIPLEFLLRSSEHVHLLRTS